MYKYKHSESTQVSTDMVSQHSESVEDSIEEVLNSVQKLSSILRINGKTQSEWDIQLKVNIPYDPTLQDITTAVISCNEHLHTAYYYFCEAETAFSIAQLAYDKAYAKSYTSIVKTSGKSTATILDMSTQEACSDNLLKLRTAELSLNFWRKQVDKLKTAQKLLHTIGWNSVTEEKLK